MGEISVILFAAHLSLQSNTSTLTAFISVIRKIFTHNPPPRECFIKPSSHCCQSYDDLVCVRVCGPCSVALCCLVLHFLVSVLSNSSGRLTSQWISTCHWFLPVSLHHCPINFARALPCNYPPSRLSKLWCATADHPNVRSLEAKCCSIGIMKCWRLFWISLRLSVPMCVLWRTAGEAVAVWGVFREEPGLQLSVITVFLKSRGYLFVHILPELFQCAAYFPDLQRQF